MVVRSPPDVPAREVLQAPALAEDLLAVLHPFPRSSVVSGSVQMHCPGRLDADLSARVTDALTLAAALRAATTQRG